MIDTKPLLALLRKMDIITHQEIDMMMQNSSGDASKSTSYYPVIVDGLFLGYVVRDKAPLLERILRAMKVDHANNDVPYTTEISLIRYSSDVKQAITQFPGLYIYTALGRLIRPVKNLAAKKIEYIGELYVHLKSDLYFRYFRASLFVCYHRS
jgi:hypothetical protein